MRVGADAGVGVGHAVAVEDDPGEVLDVDLVHDPGAGRHDLEVVERALPPPQELVTLAVALVLQLDIPLEGVGPAGNIGDHRVVDDHLGGCQRVDPARVSAELGDGLTHGGEVDDARDAGEVLHDHARRRELDLGVRLGAGIPAGEGADLLRCDVGAVLGPQEVLQQDLEAEGQPPAALNSRKTEDVV